MNKKNIMIFSPARSGSTLLSMIIGSNSRVTNFGESHWASSESLSRREDTTEKDWECRAHGGSCETVKSLSEELDYKNHFKTLSKFSKTDYILTSNKNRSHYLNTDYRDFENFVLLLYKPPEVWSGSYLDGKKMALPKDIGDASKVLLDKFYTYYEKHLEMCLSYGVKVICVSAGSPKVLTPKIKAAGAVSLHVVPNLRLAQKAAAAGVDGLVLESYEAGGHVSSEQITAFTNIPLISRNVELPIIAAGGIADGYGMAAAMALGADAVQLGTRFLATYENNANDLYKMLVVNAKENDAPVYSLEYHPGRALRSPFINKILELEKNGASSSEIRKLIGRGRAKLAAHKANYEEGMFYAGASACLVDELLSVREVFEKMLSQYHEAVSALSDQVVTGPTKAALRVVEGSSAAND